jgi:hypothetical protein
MAGFGVSGTGLGGTSLQRPALVRRVPPISYNGGGLVRTIHQGVALACETEDKLDFDLSGTQVMGSARNFL